MTAIELARLIRTANLADYTDRAMLADALEDAGDGSSAAAITNGSVRAKELLRIADQYQAEDLLTAGPAILAVARNGGLNTEITSQDSVSPLADLSGSDRYPTVTIAVTAADRKLSVCGWKVCRWLEGPNNPYNGSWIGHGWQWDVSTSDGACNGKPHVIMDDDGNVIIEHGDNVGGDTIVIGGLTEDDAEELAEYLSDAITEIYQDWAPEDADDDGLLIAMRGRCTQRSRHTVEVEQTAEDDDGDEHTEVTHEAYAYRDTHAGRPVYYVRDDSEFEELHWDADEAVAAVRDRLAEMSGLDESDIDVSGLSAYFSATIENDE